VSAGAPASWAHPDGQSALNLAAARLRHIAGTWSTKRYLNIELLKDRIAPASTALRDASAG
jgi:hypothetical protein